MTPDLDEIRSALAAATPRHPDIENADYDRLVANAPTWLASCITEIERLRRIEYAASNKRLGAERDAALAENGRLRAELLEMSDIRLERESERNAALAENERLRNTSWPELLGNREWRACADRLATCFDDWMLQAAPVREALAEYERLKGDES